MIVLSNVNLFGYDKVSEVSKGKSNHELKFRNWYRSFSLIAT